jgi:hypothetical protein
MCDASGIGPLDEEGPEYEKKAFTAVEMNSSVFWVITWRKVV